MLYIRGGGYLMILIKILAVIGALAISVFCGVILAEIDMALKEKEEKNK